MGKLEDILNALERFVGPNGAFVLMLDDTSIVEVRTRGRETTVIGLISLGDQLAEQLIQSKIDKATPDVGGLREGAKL